MLRVASLLGLCSFLVLGWAPTSKADTVIVKPNSGQRVIVKTAPSKVVIVRPAPAAPAPRQVVRDTSQPRERKVGLHFNFGGTLSQDVRMGGFSGALRVRPTPHFAFQLGSGIYGGVDYDGDDRIEVPMTADLLFFVNPKHRVQFYLLLGGGGSYARKQMFNREIRELWYAGGQAGLGVEFRLTPGFALNGDFRGFLRKRVDNDPRPEFVSGDRTTDVSGGAIFTVGGTFYF